MVSALHFFSDKSDVDGFKAILTISRAMKDNKVYLQTGSTAELIMSANNVLPVHLMPVSLFIDVSQHLVFALS